MARKTTTQNRRVSKKPASRKASEAPKRARKSDSRTVLDRDPMRPSPAERQLDREIRSQNHLTEGSISASLITSSLRNHVSGLFGKGEGHTAQAQPPKPIPSVMSRITIAQDDMDAMINRLVERLDSVLGSGKAEAEDANVKTEGHESTHHRDLLNHLFRIRQQEDLLGRIIDRLTL